MHSIVYAYMVGMGLMVVIFVGVVPYSTWMYRMDIHNYYDRMDIHAVHRLTYRTWMLLLYLMSRYAPELMVMQNV